MKTLLQKIKHLIKPTVLVAVLVATIFTLVPLPAQAEFDFKTSNDCGWNELICAVTVAIEDGIILVWLWFGKLWALFLEWAVKGTIALINLGTELVAGPVVREGFQATLGLTNLIFVIAIIIIAFSTILRFEAYSIKKMLPKLIIAALLVNFSLLIAGLFLDATNVFTYYFLKGGVSSEGIADAFNPQRLVVAPGSWQEAEVDEDDSGDYTAGTFWLEEGDLGLFLKALLAISVAILMTMLMTLVMIWVMIMVLVRNIWIMLLLMVMPLIWGFWVMPFFQQHWKKWWEKFIQWTTFLPTVTFFLWLAVNIATLDDFNNSFNDPALNIETAASSTPFLHEVAKGEGILEFVIRMLVVLGLIIGGLKTAKAFSIIGGGLVLAAGGFLGKAIMGGLGKVVTAPASLLGAAAGAIVGGKEGAKKWGGRFFGIGNTLKTAGGGVAAGVSKLAGKEQFQIGSEIWQNPITGEFEDAGRPIMSGKKGVFSKLDQAIKTVTAPNLYGRALGGASDFFAKYSATAGLASFLGKVSASQRADAQEIAKQAEGLSKKDKSNWINAKIKEGGLAAVIGAMVADSSNLHGALPHNNEDMAKLSDTIAAFHPGMKKEDIELLKNIAMHNPLHAGAVTGQPIEDVVRRATTGAIQSWDKDTYRQLVEKNLLSNAARKTWAQRDLEAQGIVFGEEIKKFASAVATFKDREKYGITDEILRKITAVGSGTASREVMNEVEEQISSLRDDKDFTKALDNVSRATLKMADDIRHVSIRTKTSDNHDYKPDASYQIISGLAKFLNGVSTSSGGPKIPSGGGSHGGGSHGGGH